VDFVSGRGVDVVLQDPYELPFEDQSVDVVVCSSCFEHSEFFWELFLDIMRVLKPTGLFYLNVPSNGGFHRYPVDCWRFYPDSGRALVNWARRNGMKSALLESFTGVQKQDIWNDFVAVFVKDEAHVALYPSRMLDSIKRYSNGLVYGSHEFQHFEAFPEDQRMNPAKRYWKKALRSAVLVQNHMRKRIKSG
jgi:SAM-dependent methyltransferase